MARRGPPVTRRRRGGLCHRSPSLANSPAVDVSSNRSVRTESSPPETHDDHQQRQVSRPAKVPGTVLKEIAGERGKINLLRSFACSVFRATIHSGVRHRFEKCCMGLRRKTTHSPKSVKPITRTRTYCAEIARRAAPQPLSPPPCRQRSPRCDILGSSRHRSGLESAVPRHAGVRWSDRWPGARGV